MYEQPLLLDDLIAHFYTAVPCVDYHIARSSRVIYSFVSLLSAFLLALRVRQRRLPAISLKRRFEMNPFHSRKKERKK